MRRALPRETLARNLRYLMDREHLSEQACAKRAGVSQKSVNNVLHHRTTTSLDIVDKLAAAFGLQGWHLILPNLPDELIGSNSIAQLYEAYSSATPEGRELIDHIAEREARRK